jgi:hypothetical protein
MQIFIYFSFFDSNSSGFYTGLPGWLRSMAIPSQTHQTMISSQKAYAASSFQAISQPPLQLVVAL